MHCSALRFGLLLAAAAVGTANVSSTGLPRIREPKYPATKKCDPALCICTPEAFVEAFLATPNLSGNSTQNPSVDTTVMNTNLCVGEHLVGRVNGWRIPSTNPTMAYLGYNQWMTFVFDNAGLEKILSLGQFRAKQILELLGFGTINKFKCDTPANRNLLVFSLKEPLIPGGCRRKETDDPTSNMPIKCNKAPIMPALWDNALTWMKVVYKRDLSHLQPAIDVIKSKRFQDLTDCDPYLVAQLADSYNASQLITAGCSTMFANYVGEYFQASSGAGCKYKPTIDIMNANAQQYLFYSEGKSTNYCESDIMFQNLGPADVLQVRAYFYAAQGLSQFYGGVGYTTNDYVTPEVKEFWVNNFAFAGKTEFATVPLDCSKSSNPFEKQMVNVQSDNTQQSGYLPYMCK